MMIQIKFAETINELKGIIELQNNNLYSNVPEYDLKKEGFVTVQHNLSLLEEMNNTLPSAIAVHNGVVIGYSLSMEKSFKNQIPVLIPMFEKIDNLKFLNHRLSEVKYIIGGQVCILKEFRGKNLIKNLYNHARTQYQERYPVMLTEVSSANERSLYAHLKCGFEILHEYHFLQEIWYILIWNWNLTKA